MSNQKDYLTKVRESLSRKKAQLTAKLDKVSARKPAKTASRLDFSIRWNGYHKLDVYCATLGTDGQYTSHSSPYGPFVEIEPPPGQEDNPYGFKDEKPLVADAIFRRLAEWWGNRKYPLPVVGTTEVEPLRIFDFQTQQWQLDPVAVKDQELSEEYAVVVRNHFERFRNAVVQRIQKSTAKLGAGEWTVGVEDCHDLYEVMYAVSDGKKSVHGRFYPPHSELVKLLSKNPYTDELERYQQLLGDAHAVFKREQELFIANVFHDVIGTRPWNGQLCYHDSGGEYDLVAKRWATDFLGREL